MCKRHGHVLGKPGLSDGGLQRVAESFADRCPNHGEPAPTKVFGESGTPQANIGLPDQRPEGPILSPPDPPDKIASCNGCKNFTPQNVVEEELGWNLNLCAAKAKLIPNNRLTKEAHDCSYAQKGDQRKDTDWFTLRTEYEEGFKWDTQAHVEMPEVQVDLSADFIEPSQYPTDKDVTAQEDSIGIRAWRMVKNPHNDAQVTYLPIFKREFFPPEEQVKIPATGQEEHPEFFVDYTGLIYTLAVEMRELKETPALWGQAGVGKTESARHLAWLMQVPFYRLSITRTTDVDDLMGKYVVAEHNGASVMVKQYGRLPVAWQKVCVFLLDEPNVGPDEVWQAIRPLTDNSKQLVIDALDGERLDRNEFCFFMMAMNPSWDAKNIGANEISDADGNRLASVFVSLPPEHVERAILKRACEAEGYALPDDVLTKIMNIAVDLRGQIEAGSLQASWGLRPQIAVARKTKWYDLVTAYRRALLDRLEPATQEQILASIRDYA